MVMDTKAFRFNLLTEVWIADGKEKGTIIGRAEYDTNEPHYLLRYIAGDGRAVEQWWGESALVEVV